jgi:hypothetical protein
MARAGPATKRRARVVAKRARQMVLTRREWPRERVLPWKNQNWKWKKRVAASWRICV